MALESNLTMSCRESAEVTAMPSLDPSLPFVHLVWADSELTRFFNRHVLPVVRPGREVVAVKQQFVHWTPGRKCTALYELQLDDPAEKSPLRAVVSFDQDDRKLKDAYERHHGRGSEISGNDPPPALSLPDYRCLVEVFPRDWMLPSLARAMSPDEMFPILTAALGDDAEPHRWRCEVSELGYRPHSRAVLLYSVQGPKLDDRREFIGKVHRKATRAAKTFANHRQIHALAADRELVIPEPLVFAESLNLMLMERARGTLLHGLLLEPTEARPAAETVRTAARALATFHTLPFEGRDARSLPRRLIRLRQRVAALHVVDPDLAPRVETMLDRIERLSGQFECARPCLIHGDFTPHQLIVTDGGTALVDFDGVGLGDPAIDVGSFMAKCRTMDRLLGKECSSGTSEQFLSEYQSCTGAGSELAERARVCCGWKLLSNAVHEYLKAPGRHTHASRSSLHAILLEEVAGCLGS